MIHIIFNPVTGQIRQKSFSSQGIAPNVPEGMAVLSAPELDYGTLDLRQVYLDTETLHIISMPPQPSEYHVFNYSTKQWVLNETGAWAGIRYMRNKLLAGSDWTTMADVPLTTEKKAEWVAYRQALRAVPDQADPLAVVWPTPPN